MKSNLVSIGLRAKTGRAICVVLGGSSSAPIVVKKFEMRLTDPKVAATFQPYHAVMELPWTESQQAVRKSVKAIEAVARKAMAQLVKELKAQNMKVAGVGTVGSPDRDLSRIGNFHIRAHAAEGVLFRRVLELAAEANGLRWQTFSDKKFDEVMSSVLASKSVAVQRIIVELGRTVAPPWRADEKQAATAAWLVLHKLATDR